MGRKNRITQNTKMKHSDFNTGRRPQRKKKKDFKKYDDGDFYAESFHIPIIETEETKHQKEIDKVNNELYDYVISIGYSPDSFDSFKMLSKDGEGTTPVYCKIINYLYMRDILASKYNDSYATFTNFNDRYNDILPQAASDALFVGMIKGLNHQIYSSDNIDIMTDSEYMRNSALKWLLSGIINIKTYDDHLIHYSNKNKVMYNLVKSLKSVYSKETEDYFTDKEKGYNYINSLEKIVTVLKHIHIDVINDLSEEDLQDLLGKIVLTAYIHRMLGDESKSSIGRLDRIWIARKHHE